ncbi:hypothetical protein M9H77_18953 [Catharanthus roseus]|uniref:Uncharacterized protein n=1 Tax=Catharanthus roseus TaxID=4058 RepID=A0ACC0B903_CATRO|nr:hypothetical protein M9H77_18953 [Catharanthus roseus]
MNRIPTSDYETKILVQPTSSSGNDNLVDHVVSVDPALRIAQAAPASSVLALKLPITSDGKHRQAKAFSHASQTLGQGKKPKRKSGTASSAAIYPGTPVSDNMGFSKAVVGSVCKDNAIKFQGVANIRSG